MQSSSWSVPRNRAALDLRTWKQCRCRSILDWLWDAIIAFFNLICRPLYAIEHVNHRMILQVGPNGLIILLLLTSHSFNYRTFYQICQSNYSFCILQANINVDWLYMSRTLRPRFDIFPVIMSKQDVLYKHIYTYFR